MPGAESNWSRARRVDAECQVVPRAVLGHTGSRLFDCIDVGAHPRQILASGITFLGAWSVVANAELAKIWNTLRVTLYHDVVLGPGSVSINDHVVSEGRVG